MFRTLRHIAIAIIVSSICIGCSHNRTSDADSDSIVNSATDSIETLQEVKADTLTLASNAEDMRKYMAESDHYADYQKGIIPDLIRDVPQYAIKILMSKQDGFLIVDKATMKIYRYDRYGVPQESIGMACSRKFGAKHARRDNRTPEGYFTIEGKYDSTDWLFTDDDGNTSEEKGQFGPRFLRLKGPHAAQIGIHGTGSPWSIGGRRSHGCIRVTNENILRWYDIVQAGWPVIISPGRKDFMVNSEEGYDIPTVPVVPGTPRASYTYHGTTQKEETTAAVSTDTVHARPVMPDSVKTVQHVDSI